MSDPTRNPSRAPTTNTNTDMTEFARQKQGRANAFFFNGLELADPDNKQKNTPKAVKSNAARLSLLNGRLTQLSLTLQQQLSQTNLPQFQISRLPSLYPRPGPTIYTTGTVLVSGNVYIFRTSGTFKIEDSPTPNVAVDILVVGGGGGGGGFYGGGGGAGGVVSAQNLSMTLGTYSITVGAGGTAGTVNIGGKGGDSSITIQGTTYTGEGGGYGGSYNGVTIGGNGGCGGGGAGNPSAAGGVGSQGFAGGIGGFGSGGAGGGGMGGIGDNSTVVYTKGGDGIKNSITGSEVYYGGGGGGGSRVGGRGGLGGGGGSSGVQGGGGPGTPGIDGLGGGGGGGSETGSGATTHPGARGGSGTVIIRIL